MLATIQFPIADARRFDPDPDLHLNTPDWGNLVTDIHPQYVNRFGRAVDRRRQADAALPDEQKFCLANRALRFPDLAHCAMGLETNRFRPACAFRRLFYDRFAVVRVEAGFANEFRAPKLKDLSGDELLAIANDLCNLPTLVPQFEGPPCAKPLLAQKSALAKLYARATMPLKQIAKAQRASKLVEAGSPLLLFELSAAEAAFPCVPRGFNAVPLSKPAGLSVAYASLRTRAGRIGAWIVQRGKGRIEDVRSLRLCLMRLHAETETLDVVLKQIERDQPLDLSVPITMDRLDDYFNRRTRLINQSERLGVDQSALRGALDAVAQATSPASRDNLTERYDTARKRVAAKIEDYRTSRAAAAAAPSINIEQLRSLMVVSQFGGGNIANVGNSNSTITNTINNAAPPASEDVKAMVKTLTDQIEALRPKADPTAAAKLDKNLDALTREVESKEPDRAWYSVSLKGLKEAAEAVGELATPILTTVGKLTSALLA